MKYRAKCVVIGEDSARVQTISQYLFALEFPHEVISFDLPVKALELLRNKSADLAIIDIASADNALSLCSTIRLMDAGLPIIVIGDAGDFQSLDEIGHAVYLVRPSLFLELAPAASQLLQRGIHA